MKRGLVLLPFLAVFAIWHAGASVVKSDVFIVSGAVTYLDSFEVERLSYSKTQVPQRSDLIISLVEGDTLELDITNTTNSALGFFIDGVDEDKLTIKPGETINASWTFKNRGVFPLGDYSTANGKYLGLQGFVLVEKRSSNIKNVVWNLSDFQMKKTQQLMNAESVDFLDYQPDFFTINGDVYPEETMNPIGQITGNVGDTIRVFLVNSGKSIHSIHFHGYHVKVADATLAKFLLGASKDTVPVKPGELMELILVPDKPGKYPVHNHSLSAVVTNGLYPSGQFGIMTIGL